MVLVVLLSWQVAPELLTVCVMGFVVQESGAAFTAPAIRYPEANKTRIRSALWSVIFIFSNSSGFGQVQLKSNLQYLQYLNCH